MAMKPGSAVSSPALSGRSDTKSWSSRRSTTGRNPPDTSRLRPLPPARRRIRVSRRPHPALEALRVRYAKFNAAVTAPLVWTDEHCAAIGSASFVETIPTCGSSREET